MAICPIQTFPALDALPGIRAAFVARCPGIDTATDRATALARLAAPHAEARAAAGFRDMPFVTAEQVHGNGIATVRVAGPQEFSGVDGLMSPLRGVCLGIYVADCAAVYLADRLGRGIALVHSGKKGTESGIVPAAIRRLRDEYGCDPRDLVMQISPCIRPPHYEVDFAATIREQALSEGVGEVAGFSPCTASDLATYYSYRAESGRTGRMLALLALTP